MVLCKFWKTGNCKFGDQCRFEHPPGVGPHGQNGARPGPAPQQQQQNQFGASNRTNNQGFAPSRAPGRSTLNRQPTRDNRDNSILESYGVTEAILEEDLRERPIWMMSAYGPGKLPPVQLFGGPELEQSPEEIRTLHYMALASGTPQQSAQLEAELAGRANQQVQLVMSDMQGALKYMREGEKQHPNRKDICQQGTTHRGHDGDFSRARRHTEMLNEQRKQQGPGFQSNGPISSQPSPGFRQGVAVGQASGFGGGLQNGMNVAQPAQQPGFGQQMQSNGLGQPASAFGQPTPAFGQPAPAFGQPNSGFAQPASGFGQPAQPQGFRSEFGQKPQILALVPPLPTASPPPFGQSGMQNGNSGFGQPSAPNENIPFGGSAAQVPNGFGGGLAQQSSGLGGFGHPPLSQQPNGFMGQPQNMMQPQQQSQSAFMVTDQRNSNANAGYSGSQRPGPNHVNNEGLMRSQQTSLPAAQGDISTYAQHGADGRLLNWKGRPVQYQSGSKPCYRNDDGLLERIWFPDGPPPAARVSIRFDAECSEEIVGVYQRLKDSGNFEEGSIPELPPSRDLARWDL